MLNQAARKQTNYMYSLLNEHRAHGVHPQAICNDLRELLSIATDKHVIAMCTQHITKYSGKEDYYL